MNQQTTIDRRLSVAPMMDWTDRHDRFFLRLLTKRTLLYTEMVTTGALLHGPRERLLAFDRAEHPVALQLGGCDPAELAEAAAMGETAGYDEINLNVGCPSDRVQNGRFGACLMAEPTVVAAGVAAMRQAVKIPVTVKCRIGIDQMDDYGDLRAFVDIVSQEGGADCFIVHARKAWLKGLSPKENREVPPLIYGSVYRLKQERPDLIVVINGGIQSLEEASAHLDEGVDGVMIGRSAYQNPYIMAAADRAFFGGQAAVPERREIVAQLLPYIERQMTRGVPLKSITRHILGLYNGLPGARVWRRVLSEEAHKPGAGPEVVSRACEQVEELLARKAAA
ncbi:tRNA dihydrouridine(20/20a) synthase DusA [Limibacillus sp. MBR-115]|uniref:tRNA dihydrouridine(20/20a) synthase DusA n=1 Tax=Limibacillus sp. MBR-115 TaxID=3156465 RepID=UPI003392348E